MNLYDPEITIDILRAPDRKAAFKGFETMMRHAGMGHVMLVERPMVGHARKPIVHFKDVWSMEPDGDPSIDWPARYALMQYHKRDVLFEAIKTPLVWEDVAAIRMKDDFSTAIHGEMVKFRLEKAFVTSSTTLTGNVAAMIVASEERCFTHINDDEIREVVSLAHAVLMKPEADGEFANPPFIGPSDQQYDILMHYVADGLPDKEISAILDISVDTVGRRCKKIRAGANQYLGVKDRLTSRPELTSFLKAQGYGSRFC